jgi:hypothetical protein
MSQILKIDQKLIEIASESGNPAALDNPKEKAAAETFLTSEIASLKQADADCCIIDMAEGTLEALKQSDGSQAFAVNHLFGDERDIDCGIFCWSSPNAEFAEPLEGDQVASFRVYVGTGHESHKVAISKSEWEFIIAPLKELQKWAEDPSSPDYDDGGVSAERANKLMGALGQSVTNFEKTVGSKAGTAKDIGGLEGEGIARTRELADKQQDVVSELMTTRQVISAFSAVGLLSPWAFDPASSIIDAVVNMHGGFRMAFPFARVRDEYGVQYAVDSWSESGGTQVHIAPADIVSRYIAEEMNKLRGVSLRGGGDI